ncbi:alpha/beta fold hydrolase [Actinopolymorpha pittospori]
MRTDRHVVTSGDARIAVRDTGGEGQAVVLVHGLGSTQRSWDRLVRLLAPRCRVVTYDQRGHGRTATSGDSFDHSLDTSVADLIAVMDAREIRHPTLVGHSLGASVVVAAAASRGCHAVITVDGGMMVERPHASMDRDAFLAEQRRPSVRSVTRLVRVLGLGTRMSSEQLWEALAAAPAWERAVDPLYDELTCGVLQVLAGRADPVPSGAGLLEAVRVAAVRFQLDHPAVRQVWVDSGHAVQLERPAELADHIREFAFGPVDRAS